MSFSAFLKRAFIPVKRNAKFVARSSAANNTGVTSSFSVFARSMLAIKRIYSYCDARIDHNGLGSQLQRRVFPHGKDEVDKSVAPALSNTAVLIC